MAEEKNREMAGQLTFYDPCIGTRTMRDGSKETWFRCKLDPACVGKATILTMMEGVCLDADVFVRSRI